MFAYETIQRLFVIMLHSAHVHELLVGEIILQDQRSIKHFY